MTNQPDGFICKFCHHVFRSELRYEKHRCSEMDKYEKLYSVLGNSAYRYFNEWNKLNKRSTCTKKTFGTSKYFHTFYNFVLWKKQVKLPDVSQYIRLMVMWQLEPRLWTKEQVYSKFIEFIDRQSTVEDHIRNTWKTIEQVRIAANCSRSEIFENMEPYMILDYVRSRKFSPWVLLKMKGFKIKYKTLPEGMRLQFNEVIRPKYWSELMSSKIEDTQLIIDFLAKVNL